MAQYRILNPSTGKVVNLYSTSSTGSVANGTRLLLYTWQDNNDQKWELGYVGSSALLRLARDKSKVLNRNSGNNNAHVWTYNNDAATNADSLIDTETVGINTRIKLVQRNLYLTKNAGDNYLSWTSKIDSDRQYFKLEDISGGSTSGKGLNFLRPLDNSHPLTTGYSATHKALDIDGVRGELLRAAGYGKVIYTNFATSTDASKIESLGYAVFIEHYNADGSVCGMTVYAHMDRIDVQVNQYVAEGANIGTVGITGRVIAGAGGDGSHLHFILKTGSSFNASSLYNIYHSGNFTDPTPYIFRA